MNYQLSFEIALGSLGILLIAMLIGFFILRRNARKYDKQLDDSHMEACEGLSNGKVTLYHPVKRDQKQNK